jgi:HPr kinase/phosphorylase
LAGLIEVRGLGIRRVPFEPLAVVSWVVDLAAEITERLPQPRDLKAIVSGVSLPRLAVASGCDALPMVRAALTSGFLPGNA